MQLEELIEKCRLTLDELCLIKMEHIEVDDKSVVRKDIAAYVKAVRDAQLAKVLSLTLKRKRQCPQCYGKGTIWVGVNLVFLGHRRREVQCPTCEGKLRVEEKSIKDILGGWSDDKV